MVLVANISVSSFRLWVYSFVSVLIYFILH